MTTGIRKPDFFIVGAPKCGTTSMNDYLKQHPDIYMPESKEPHFFGSDLQSPYFMRDPHEYQSLYAAADGEKRAGDASVWYLYSRLAAQEIRDFCPSADIIIMLRNPVDMIYSLHSQRLWNGNEDIEDFEEALAAEEDRRHGRRLPRRTGFAGGLFYRDTARYAAQVKRYLDIFGHAHVRIIIFDDLRKDSAAVYRDTLRFLGVATEFTPQLAVVNPNKRVRSRLLREVLRQPPEPVRRIAKIVMPLQLRDSIRSSLKRFNTQYVSRAPLDPGLRKKLLEEFRPDIEQLSTYLDRDLVSLWDR